MSFSITDFKSNLSRRNGILPKNRFIFRFAPPSNISSHPLSQAIDLHRDLEFLCHNVNIPSRSVRATGHKRYGVGLNEMNTLSGDFGTVTATFFADARGETMALFDSWIQYAMGTYSQLNNSPDMFDVPYRDQIVTDGAIEVYDQSNRLIRCYNLFELHPMHILDTQLAWEEDNQLLTFTVTFSIFNMSADTYHYNAVDPYGGMNNRINGGKLGTIPGDDPRVQSRIQELERLNSGPQGAAAARVVKDGQPPPITKYPPDYVGADPISQTLRFFNLN